MRITGGNGARYSRDELLAAFPPLALEKPASTGPKPSFASFRAEGDLGRFVEPLDRIPPDDYGTWLEIGMALHHETSGSADGLAAWDAWSAKSSKWVAGECEDRWRTFHAGGGVTGGTIFALAETFGFQRRQQEPRRDWQSTHFQPVLDDKELQSEHPDHWVPSGFRRLKDGSIEFQAGETRDGEPQWQWLCSAIEVTAETSNEIDKEHGRLVRIYDLQNKRWHEWAMPMRLLAGDAAVYIGEFLSMGARISLGKGAKTALASLIQNARIATDLRCVTRTGWFGDHFIMPQRVIGISNDRGVVFQSNRPVALKFRSSGTLEQWKESVAAPAVGNHRMALAISVAFAAPCLRLAKQEGGGFHFVGGSSSGKTTALTAAGSVWGGGGLKGYVENWTGTVNGTEGRAQAHCDALLCLQELGQADADAAADAAYKLANGQGKSRMTADVQMRETPEWRLLFLSDGEITLDDKIRESRRGGRMMAGQAVRVVDIPADAGKGHGAFDVLHGFESGRKLSEHVAAAVEEYHGTAAIAFLERLTADIPAATEFLRIGVDAFVSANAHDCGAQAQRVAKRFGLVAAAGELAVKYGVLPWPEGSATASVTYCFFIWLARRGTKGATEIEDGIDQVRRFIERDGASRFVPWMLPSTIVPNRLGFARRYEDFSDAKPDSEERRWLALEGPTVNAEGQVYYILPGAWKEMCLGFNQALIARALIDRGVLLGSEGGKKFTSKPRLPGMGATRCYVIDARKLFSEGDAGGQGGHDEQANEKK